MGLACRACVGVANKAWPVLECPVWQWPLCTRLEISISVMPALKAYPILLISFVKWFSFTFFQEKISENTDNIANLPERIAIEEAKRLVAPTEPETFPFRTVQNQRTIDDNVIEDSIDNRQEPMNLRTFTKILFTL